MDPLKLARDMAAGEFMQSTPLHEAVTLGDVEAVRTLLDEGADVNGREWMGQTPLSSLLQSDGEGMAAVRTAMRGMESGIEPGDPAFEQSLDQAMRKAEAAVKRRRGKPLPEDTAIVSLLLERGADVRAVDDSGLCALAWAAANGRPESARLLLAHGAHVDQPDTDGLTPLMHAASEGHLPVVRLLLAHGARIDARTLGGSTVLIAAARGGNADVVRELLARGADVAASSDDGTTALAMALMRGHDQAAALLREAGAPTGFLEALAAGDVPAAGELPSPPRSGRSASWGGTVLWWAAREGHAEVANLLLESGADPNHATGKHGSTALSVAVMFGGAEVTRPLLEAGADPNAVQAVGVGEHRSRMLPLAWAAHRGDVEVARLLLEHGADPNAADEHGHTVLVSAVMGGSAEVTALLLEHGADANPSAGMLTPLAFATVRGGADLVRLLVEHGATGAGTHPPGPGRTGQPRVGVPAEVLLRSQGGNPEIEALLRQAAGTDVYEAAKSGDLEEVRRLLDAGRAPDQPARIGDTALMAAAEAGHVSVIELLLERGADPKHANDIGVTALHEAVANGHEDSVRLLLGHGADPNHESQLGFTPLVLCGIRERLSLAPLLMEAGARVGPVEAGALGAEETLRAMLDAGRSPDDANAAGLTPLMTASACGHIGIVAMLLDRGAAVNAQSARGETALPWAAGRGREDVVRLLLERGADPNRFSPEAAQTPLAAAVASPAVLKLLLERGADVNAAARFGHTALHRAAALPDGRCEGLRILLEAGADPARQDRLRLTPLMTAAMMGKEEAASILLQHGADPATQTEMRKRALELAERHGHTAVAALLRRAMGLPDAPSTTGTPQRPDFHRMNEMLNRAIEEIKKRRRGR